MNNDFDVSDICCAVVTYNGDASTIENISGLFSSLETVIVIDNGSKEDFIKRLRNDVEPYSTVLFNSDNKGIAAALNQAAEYARRNKKRLLLTMDQDSRITIDTIKALLDHLEVSKGIVSVGPGYEGNKKNEFVKYLITSGNLVLTEAVFEIGGFSDYLFIDEVDIDFSFALRKRGYRLLKVNNASMSHKIGEYEQSRFLGIKYLSHAPLRFYYIYRNTLWIAKKYFSTFPLDSIKLLLALIVVDTGRLVLIERDKKNKMKYALKGIKDGIRSHNADKQ